ncbi:acylphosphatase [Primorskyibacter sedentarius]|uniref:acylphosphatase n=1 Tax=Primorskyibacter sedentarius TaxID=745311 RepID=UPI0010510460|nr:acylphosphatase [Primorskyibacter sedentarius]
MTREIARQARVMGRVQGVAFRVWTQAAARRQGLRGWVHNNDDGSVTTLLVGAEDAVKAMLLALRDGPGAAAVRDVLVDELEDLPDVEGFEITG